MPGYTAQIIAGATGGQLFGNPDLIIRRLLTDSRSLAMPNESMFVALVGERHDGHAFIPDLAEKGVRAFLISRLPAVLYPDVVYILTDNTLDALQKLAAWHRAQFSSEVVGITGSNGKTVVKEWLFQIMRENLSVVRSPRSYNSQVGVPLSVWMAEDSHNLGIFEAGISMPGEMEKLAKIIAPDSGIFTHPGPAHQENFSSLQHKLEEKMLLFAQVKELVFCGDYPELNQVVQSFFQYKKCRLFQWSRKESNADVFITEVRSGNRESAISYVFGGSQFSFSIPFTDDASVENACSCLAWLLMKGFDSTFITERLGKLEPVEMRLELKEGLNNCTVINDSYNSDLHSFRVAMDYLVRQGRHKRKVVILSDILQGGINEADLYSEVSDILNGHKTDLLVSIGTRMEKFSGLFKMPAQFFRTAADFIQHLPELKIKNSDILIKGARPFGFETISARLQQKAHETVLEINLNALASNFNYLKSLLPAGTKTMAMVKAFSYGSGLLEIASQLRFLGADYLAVAFADEGVELRQSGITLPVMVMSPEPEAFGAMISYSLEPEIYSFRMLGFFLNEARRCAVRDFPVHIKFDTGMKRLGFEAADLEKLAAILNDQHYLRVKSVFSHLAAAEDASEDEFTLSQAEKFQSIASSLSDCLGYAPEMHLLNSAGMMRFPQYAFNMVRLGIGLYGIGPDDKEKLQNVVSLKTVISQIRKVAKGETVGYNRKGMIDKDSLIATIPLGYADGLSRRLGNGNAEFIIGNSRVKTIGNVCMDMCMANITGLNVNEGDEVIVFNDQKSLLGLAKASETIPYEVLTGISRRVKRVYFHE